MLRENSVLAELFNYYEADVCCKNFKEEASVDLDCTSGCIAHSTNEWIVLIIKNFTSSLCFLLFNYFLFNSLDISYTKNILFVQIIESVYRKRITEWDDRRNSHHNFFLSWCHTQMYICTCNRCSTHCYSGFGRSV